MKRILLAALAAALWLCCWAQAGAEQTQMDIYVSSGALTREAALQLAAMAQSAYPSAAWNVVFEEETGESLRDLVLADRAPQIAICPPQEALPWAKEGLLWPLEGCAERVAAMQEEVVQACVWDESLFMLPLQAGHRRVAVNARIVESLGLGFLLDARAHPVWMPSELYQLVEEASFSQGLAMEVWQPRAQDVAGIEAFVCGLYGGALMAEDGTLAAQSQMTVAGLKWLGDMASAGVIGVVRERETVLEHFIGGQTALFIDWTDEDARRYGKAMRENGLDVYEITYPTADAVSVRSFELTGVSVFKGHDAQASYLAMQALKLWDERAQGAIGERGVWRDGAVWLPCLNAKDGGATLRSLFAEAVRAVLAGELESEAALRRMAGVYGAAAGD